MNRVLCTPARQHLLFLGLILALFITGCSKHEDDCSAPKDEQEEAPSKAFVAGDGPNTPEFDEAPAARSNHRSGESQDDPDDDGISDDGDDEADGEGNKKSRPLH